MLIRRNPVQVGIKAALSCRGAVGAPHFELAIRN